MVEIMTTGPVVLVRGRRGRKKKKKKKKKKKTADGGAGTSGWLARESART